MYIYNITTNVSDVIHDDWLRWMRNIFIPEMLATGKFSKAKMTKVLVKEEMGGVTYSVQYTTDSLETLSDFYKNDALKLQEKSTKLFKNQFVDFTTELEVVSDHYSPKN